VEPVLGLIKAAAREVVLGDELVAAVLAAGFDDAILASLLLKEDTVVAPEMLAEVELSEGEMLLDENGVPAIILEVENEDRLLLMLGLEVLVVESSTNVGEVLFEVDEEDALLKVEEVETLMRLTTIVKLLELDNEDRASEPDDGGAVLMLEEIGVLESVIRVTFEEGETVLVVISIPEPEVSDAGLKVTVGSRPAELVAKETLDATTWLGIRAVVEREVVVGTVVARAEASQVASKSADVVVLFNDAEMMVPVVSCVVFAAKDMLGSDDVVLVLEADMAVIFELVARLALPLKPETDEYEMIDRAEVIHESSEMVEVPVLLALLELATVVVVILYRIDPGATGILFKSNFAGALRLSCVDSTQMEGEAEDMAAFVGSGIATATVECRTLHPGDKPVLILAEVSSVTAIHFQDNQKTEWLVPRLCFVPELELEAFGRGVP
jgi:hypothetical protein